MFSNKTDKFLNPTDKFNAVFRMVLYGSVKIAILPEAFVLIQLGKNLKFSLNCLS